MIQYSVNVALILDACILVNPSLNSHQSDGDFGAGRGFGRGFRGRGGIRPGLGRGGEFIPPEMAMATPWMGESKEWSI